MFDEVIYIGQIPNVFTYNPMTLGFCMVRKFDKACLMLKEMDSKGCYSKFVVYSRLLLKWEVEENIYNGWLSPKQKYYGVYGMYFWEKEMCF